MKPFPIPLLPPVVRLLVCTLLATGLTACLTLNGDAADPPAPGGWGKYQGPIRAEWEPGRKMRLLEDTHYFGPEGRDWFAPKGWEIDGASIPQAFWCSVGGPFEGAYRDASVFHDVACDRRTARWQDVHYMFYTAMRCSGVSEVRAKVMYAAVYRFGPRWDEPAAAVFPQVFGMRERGPRRFSHPAAPRRQPTEAEAREIEAFVREKNPSLQQIEQTQALPGTPGASPTRR